MNCIQLMIDEHKYIKRMLVVIRRYCMKILYGEDIQYEDFYKIIDFVRNYADKHHHGKEETMLFDAMMRELGSAGEKITRYGMNVEHIIGRAYIQNLEDAVKRVLSGDRDARLDVIANAVSYTHLLHSHIEKEDTVVYKFAENKLMKESLDILNEDTEKFEVKAQSDNVQARYISLLEELETKE